MQATQIPPQQGGHAGIHSIVTLALWRGRQTWHFLLLTGLGMLAAVVIVCVVPLFSQVALTAGVRSVLTASPADSEIELQIETTDVSQQIVAQGKNQLSGFMRAELRSYLSSYSQFMLQLPGFSLATTPSPSSPDGQSDKLLLTGVSIDQARSHLRLLQGQLPLSSSPDIEIVLTQRTASDLEASVGSIVSLHVSFFVKGNPAYPASQYVVLELPLHVVGIVALDGSDPFWHGQDFEPVRAGFASSYRAIMSNDAFLATLTQLASEYGGTMVQFDAHLAILWFFFLNDKSVTISNLDDLITHLNSAQLHLDANTTTAAYLRNPQLTSPTMNTYGASGTLERFRERIPVVQIPLALLTIQIIALMLFFVSVAASIALERQAEIIALLRSRGASRRLVFSAFALHMLVLGLLVLCAGPPLALLLARFLGSQMLAPADQSALTLVTTDPLQAALGLRWYAILAMAAAVSATIFSLWGAVRQDVLVLRRELARPARRPLWQRLRLDLVAASIALAGYGISLYLLHAGALDARTNQVLLLPVSLVGPICLLITAVLLFLRLFPLLLRLVARRATRWLGAPLMLALAQLSRAPQQSIRVVLLLALSVSFAIFSLVFNASEAQQMSSVAAQQVGADFSGSIPIPLGSHPVPSEVERAYRGIPGVTSATIGYATDGISSTNGQTAPLQIRAVDITTFAQTATWTDQDSRQPLAELLTQLSAPLPDGGATSLVVPALVDAVFWNSLQLTPGATFFVNITGSSVSIMFQAIAEVQHIPTINDSLQTNGGNDYSTPGGILVDLALYTQVFEQASKINNQTGTQYLPPAINYVWLRTADSAPALAQVRAALTSGPLSLEVVYDRRAMIAQMQRDPLSLALSAVLILGASTALLLALVGSLLATWLSIGSRLTHFSVLRALGSTPRQIARILAWEQGIVYSVALLLGSLFGMLLVLTVVPGLVFTDPVPPGTGITDTEFYVIQHVLPVQLVLSPTLAIASTVFIAICALVLTLMIRLATKPALSQTLRLNQE